MHFSRPHVGHAHVRRGANPTPSLESGISPSPSPSLSLSPSLSRQRPGRSLLSQWPMILLAIIAFVWLIHWYTKSNAIGNLEDVAEEGLQWKVAMMEKERVELMGEIDQIRAEQLSLSRENEDLSLRQRERSLSPPGGERERERDDRPGGHVQAASANAKYIFVVKVIGYNRMATVRRLLSSLSDAEYGGDTVHLEVFLDNADRSPGARALREFVREWEWVHGTKRVVWRARNSGLVLQWMEMWYPDFSSGIDEYTVVLEDDVEVSPYWYLWARSAVEHYALQKTGNNIKSSGKNGEKSAETETENPNFVPEMCGLSLYNTQYSVLGQATGVQHVDFEVTNGRRPYLFQNPMSWGPVLFPNCWREFREWFDESVNWESENQRTYAPFLASNNWFRSWLQWFIRFHYEKGRVFLYPNLGDNRSFLINHFEVGDHYKDKRMSREQLYTKLYAEDLVMPAKEDLQTFDLYSVRVHAVSSLRERGKRLLESRSYIQDVALLLPIPEEIDPHDFTELKHNHENTCKDNIYIKYLHYLRALFPDLTLFRTVDPAVEFITSNPATVLFTVPQYLSQMPESGRVVVVYFEGSPMIQEALMKGNLDKQIADRYFHLFHSSILREDIRKIAPSVIGGYRQQSETVYLPPMFWTHRYDWPSPRTQDSNIDGPYESSKNLPVILVKIENRVATRGVLESVESALEKEKKLFYRLRYHLQDTFKLQQLDVTSTSAHFPRADIYVSLCFNGIVDLDLIEALYADKVVLTTESARDANGLPPYVVPTVKDKDAVDAKVISDKIVELWAKRRLLPSTASWIMESRSLDDWYSDMARTSKSIVEFYTKNW